MSDFFQFTWIQRDVFRSPVLLTIILFWQAKKMDFNGLWLPHESVRNKETKKKTLLKVIVLYSS